MAGHSMTDIGILSIVVHHQKPSLINSDEFGKSVRGGLVPNSGTPKMRGYLQGAFAQLFVPPIRSLSRCGCVLRKQQGGRANCPVCGSADALKAYDVMPGQTDSLLAILVFQYAPYDG
jgi:hypothetical protein